MKSRAIRVRTQTVADLESARWALLGCEDPLHVRKPAASFWAGVRMPNAVARRHWAGHWRWCRWHGTWSAILSARWRAHSQVREEPQGVYVKVEIGSAFDTAHSGLGLMAGLDADLPGDLGLAESLWAIIRPQSRSSAGTAAFRR